MCYLKYPVPKVTQNEYDFNNDLNIFKYEDMKGRI